MGELSREFKINLIKAVFHKEEFDTIINHANPYELSDIQEFLWEAALYIGRDEEGNPLTRQSITARMMPTSDYWRSQLCGEPIDTCRGRSCFVSHPVCAGNKLKGQIEVIRQFFDRRKQRAVHGGDAMLMMMMYHINENNYAAGGLYTFDGRPHFTVGSRVLEGDTLKKIIHGMNAVMIETPLIDRFSKEIHLGDTTLIVHARKHVPEPGGDEAYIAIAVNAQADMDALEKVFKKIEGSIERIDKQAKVGAA